jgi:hypothetical protein
MFCSRIIESKQVFVKSHERLVREKPVCPKCQKSCFWHFVVKTRKKHCFQAKIQLFINPPKVPPFFLAQYFQFRNIAGLWRMPDKKNPLKAFAVRGFNIMSTDYGC